MRLRIGVHLGDVIVEGDDLYGHGINIASRIEGLAKAGEVLVSDAVFQQIKGVYGFSFASLGEQALKNIPELVLVYRVSEGEAEEAVDIRFLLSKPAVAVLPFTNMSGDPEQE
jgi:adenylate cyclase